MRNTSDASATHAAVAGAVSGGSNQAACVMRVTRLIAAPLDLLKIRFQVQTAPITNAPDGTKYTSFRQAVRSIYAEEGLRSFWRGNLAASGLWVSYSGIQFACYRELTRWSDIHATPNIPTVAITAANGAVAGVTATIVTYPLDFFRTAFASQGIPKRFPTIRSLMWHTWMMHGFRGFYSGLGSAVFQIAPYIGLSFSFYSILSERSINYDRDGEQSRKRHFTTALTYIGNGAVAGLVSKLAVYPLDTIKKRMQMRHVSRCATYGPTLMYSSSWSCFLDVLQREGIRGLYKGTLPSLLKSAVASSSTFATYELTLEMLRYISSG